MDFYAIGNEELSRLPFYAENLQDENGKFEIIHTHDDGSQEICKVSSEQDSEGYKLWTIGGYTTKAGKKHS